MIGFMITISSQETRTMSAIGILIYKGGALLAMPFWIAGGITGAGYSLYKMTKQPNLADIDSTIQSTQEILQQLTAKYEYSDLKTKGKNASERSNQRFYHKR